MYVSLARACDPSTRKLEEIFNHFTYQIETPPHTPHIEYKVSPAFHSKFLTTTRWRLTLTMTIIYQKKDSFKFSFFFSFFLKQIPSHIFHSRSAPNFVFLFGRWLSNNYQLFIYRPRGAVQRIKPDSRPLDARRGCPPPPPFNGQLNAL